MTSDKMGICELQLIGHTKRIKSNSQNIFNENILASCGGDGIIFIWDKRNFDRRYCNSQCPHLNSGESHIHPVGAFRNVYKDLVLKKKYSPNIGLLNCEVHNTFTDVDFYDSNLIVSTETNNDDLKFWEMRNMLTSELEYFFNNEKRITKKELIKKLDAKNYLSSISPYSHLYMKYNIFKQKNRLSSKYNTNCNLLFPIQGKKRKKNEIQNNNHNNQMILDCFLEKMKKDFNTQLNIEKDLEHDNNINNNIIQNNNINNNMEIEENVEMEIYYKEKIKQSRNKRGIKGLTSLNINREKGLILINSISGYQYIYDHLFLDEKEPIELKLSTSSLFVKSVLSNTGRYVLSGSKGPEMVVWDLNEKDNEGNIKMLQFSSIHKRDVNAVDWGRNVNNFIASGCDAGLVAIWDVNK